MLHWAINNNSCALTIIEHYIRCYITKEDVPICESFTYKLIAPVYDFNKNYQSFSSIIYIVTTMLWLITVSKLYKKIKNKEIKTLEDLLKIK